MGNLRNRECMLALDKAELVEMMDAAEQERPISYMMLPKS